MLLTVDSRCSALVAAVGAGIEADAPIRQDQHVGRAGRPVGGEHMSESVSSSPGEAAGGESVRAEAIRAEAVRGGGLEGGTEAGGSPRVAVAVAVGAGAGAGAGAGVGTGSGAVSEREREPQVEVGHPHAQTGQVPQVRRRRSPIDPPDGSWAVIGAGGQRSVVLGALASVGIPVVGYERNPRDFDRGPNHAVRVDAPESSDPLDQYAETDRPHRLDNSDGKDHPDRFVRFDHVVIAVDEIDDIEGLAVTSWDRLTEEINTDYYAGIVVATQDTGFCGDLIDSAGLSSSPESRIFTPHHPAVVLVGPAEPRSDSSPVPPAGVGARARADAELGTQAGPGPIARGHAGPGAGAGQFERAQADFVAAYAKLLADSPRSALSFHRLVSSGTEQLLGMNATAEAAARQELSSSTVAAGSGEATGSVGAPGDQEPTLLLRRLLREIADASQVRSAEGPS